MYFQHQCLGLGLAFEKHHLEHLHHEIHGGEVVVVYVYFVALRLFGLGTLALSGGGLFLWHRGVLQIEYALIALVEEQVEYAQVGQETLLLLKHLIVAARREVRVGQWVPGADDFPEVGRAGGLA